MALHSQHWSLNEAEVAAKVIDGEAILLHLNTGLYYSLAGTACHIWEMLAAGLSADQVSARLRAGHPDAAAQAEGDVARLVEQLEQERLIVPAEGPGAGPTEVLDVTAVFASPYTTPTLDRYSDMADLLALDPPMPGLLDGPWTEDEKAK